MVNNINLTAIMVSKVTNVTIFSLAFLFVSALFFVTANAASLSFSTIPTQSVGQNFDAQVLLNTTSFNINAVDTIINYDPSLLSVVNISNGSIFAAYPLSTSNNGQISISGIDSTFSSPFNGTSGVFATITFRPIAVGSSSLTFDYSSGSTLDSNVVEENTALDRLDQVSNSTFTIADSGTGGTSGGTLPETGIFDSTRNILIASGFIMLIIGEVVFLHTILKLPVRKKHH